MVSMEICCTILSRLSGVRKRLTVTEKIKKIRISATMVLYFWIHSLRMKPNRRSSSCCADPGAVIANLLTLPQ